MDTAALMVQKKKKDFQGWTMLNCTLFLYLELSAVDKVAI